MSYQQGEVTWVQAVESIQVAAAWFPAMACGLTGIVVTDIGNANLRSVWTRQKQPVLQHEPTSVDRARCYVYEPGC